MTLPATGSIHFRTAFHSSDLQQLEIPVEVRTQNLTVVARTTSTQSVGGLAPGRYFALARLPAGQELTCSVDIPDAPGPSVEAVLEPREQERSPHETEELSRYLGLPVQAALPASRLFQQASWNSPMPAAFGTGPQVPAGGLAAVPGQLLEPAVLRDVGGFESLGPAPAGTGDADIASLLDEFAQLQLETPAPVRANVTGSPASQVLESLGPVIVASTSQQPAARLPSTDALDVQLAVYRGNALALKSSPVRDDGIWRDIKEDKGIRLRIEGMAAVSVLQVRQAGRPPLHIALPISGQRGCTVELSRLPAPLNPSADVDVISIDLHIDNVEADSLLRYRATGTLRQAEATLAGEQTRTAEQLLSDKFDDPIAAVVGGYALLRFNRLERLSRSNWTRNLCDKLPWLPDAAVICGEHMARQGQHQEALDAFLLMAQRGLPLFAEGLSYTLDRLDLYLRTKASRLNPEKLQRARSLVALLQTFCPYTDYRRQLLSYIGSSPNTPGNESPPAVRASGAAAVGTLTLHFDGQLGGSAQVIRTPAAQPAGSVGALEVLGAAETTPGSSAQSGGALRLPPHVMASTQQRFDSRAVAREEQVEKIKDVKQGKSSLLEVDAPQSIALRSQRVLSQPLVQDALAASLGGSQLESLGSVDTLVLERILGGNNLLGTVFLKIGTKVSRTVARIRVNDQSSSTLGFGTGSLVSPRLLMTNHHVLTDAQSARFSEAEFDFEKGEDGRPLPVSTFALLPELFFHADPELDFSLVAVAERSEDGKTPLSQFGFNRLSQELGKIILGESVNIIQHPDGRSKQIALQQNELIDRLDNFLHYQTDTAPGSSGSPLYNNQWEMIGLHHSGVPARNEAGQILALDGRVWNEDMGETSIKWVANEGARISSILTRLQSLTNLGSVQQQLVDQVLSPPLVTVEEQAIPAPVAVPPALPPQSPIIEPPPMSPQTSVSSTRLADSAGAMVTAGEVNFALPITITVSVGTPGSMVHQAARSATPAASAGLLERLTPKQPIIDRNYASRSGYDPKFLGPDFLVPVPEVTDLGIVSRMLGNDGGYVIPYEHFSVVMHKERRLALFTASNVDGRKSNRQPEPGRDYTRKGLTGLGDNNLEEWITDQRIAEADQLSDRFYSNDRGAFDKGHIVRRDDVCWGNSYAQVQRANGDTYHTTNCSPQVAGYNQSARGVDNWGDLENFVLMQAKSETYCVFAGPVFRSTDKQFRGVDNQGPVSIKIPRSFWKLIVARKGDRLQAFAFVLEQDLTQVPLEALRTGEVLDPRSLEFLPTSEWKKRMVSIAALEGRLGNILRFPATVRQADQVASPDGQEVARFARLEL
ncbi:DNA/RNA non-specific endonuclease [Variovorax sp. LjRoot84]|uniref:DNA/RNA non-specific endonuclease n=1 Tax=Variovorax sp. LjRoot84 TaxID=3342340 RepID=UPI003ECFCF9D